MNKVTMKSFRNSSQTNISHKRKLKSDLQNVVKKSSPLVIGKPLASKQKDNGQSEMIKYIQYLEDKLRKKEKTKIFTNEDTQSERQYQTYKKCEKNMNSVHEYLTNHSIIDKQLILNILKKSPKHKQISTQQKTHKIQQLNQIIYQLTIENQQLKHQQKQKKAYQYTVDKLLEENIKYKTMLNTFNISKNQQNKHHIQLLQENQYLRHQNQYKEVQIAKQKKQIQKDYKRHIETLNKILQQNMGNIYKSIQKKQKIIRNQVDKVQAKLRITEDALSIIKVDYETKKAKRRMSQFSATMTSPNFSVFLQNQQLAQKRSNLDNKKHEQDIRIIVSKMEQTIQQLQNQNNRVILVIEEKEQEIKQKNINIQNLQNQIVLLNKRINEAPNSNQQTRQQKTNNIVQYVKQVQNIRQMLLSCNPSNFNMFQTQFKQIIQQRNSLNNKIQKFKEIKQKKCNSNTQHSSNHLVNKIKALEQQNWKLQQQVQWLQKQLQQKRTGELQNIDIQLINSVITLKDSVEGYQGLQWQKIVQQCIFLTADKLEKLTSEMQKS